MQIRLTYERVSGLLSPAVKSKIRQIVPLYLAGAGSLRSTHAIHQSAIRLLRMKVPSTTPAQTDLHVFYLLSMAAIVRGDVKGGLDSMNEMSEMTSMRLQMAMDRRSKFVEALSHLMMSIDSTQEAIVQNMKG